MANSYKDNLRIIKSISIVSSLQKRPDINVMEIIQQHSPNLDWSSPTDLMIEDITWNYAVIENGYSPELIFCHPELLLHDTRVSLYYRGLCALSMKAMKDYGFDPKTFEVENKSGKLNYAKALEISRVYNTFICSIISGSDKWTLENGRRTIIATLGITLDGIMRNTIGQIAEGKIKELVLKFCYENNIIVNPVMPLDELIENKILAFDLNHNFQMKFSSEPDIAFVKNERELVACVEIKGGTDPAGALERYGAATKSFQYSLEENSMCKNFFISAVYTPELERRIKKDRLVEKYFDLVELLENKSKRQEFLHELFHFTLRLI